MISQQPKLLIDGVEDSNFAQEENQIYKLTQKSNCKNDEIKLNLFSLIRTIFKKIRQSLF